MQYDWQILNLFLSLFISYTEDQWWQQTTNKKIDKEKDGIENDMSQIEKNNEDF